MNLPICVTKDIMKTEEAARQLRANANALELMKISRTDLVFVRVRQRHLVNANSGQHNDSCFEGNKFSHEQIRPNNVLDQPIDEIE